MSPRNTLKNIVFIHAEEVAALFIQRLNLETSPEVKLDHLERLDSRIAANLDALSVAGEQGWKTCLSLLESASPGETFCSAAMALTSGNTDQVSRILTLYSALSEVRSSIGAAGGWTNWDTQQHTQRALLASGQPAAQQLAINVFSQHRADPGANLQSLIQNLQSDCPKRAPLFAAALEAAGLLGRRELLPEVEQQSRQENTPVRFQASWSAALLGSQNTLRQLGEFALQPCELQHRALSLLLKILPLPSAHNFIQALSNNPANPRAVIKAVGITGDPFYMPWLIQQMNDLQFSRLAGESFSFITGVDLAYQDLERKPPEDFESGPNDDPNDPNVDQDEDDNLPWPDVQKVTHWWWQHSQQFQQGTRYFMGKTISGEHCLEVLKNGFQRQRMAAAVYLCLLNPGSVLFPTAAPAWRQKKLLEDWPANAPRKPEPLNLEPEYAPR